MGIALFLPALLLAQHTPEANGLGLVLIARGTIWTHVLGMPNLETPDLGPAKGVFVTIERNGKILGCRGSLSPHSKGITQEVVSAATAACSHDPRYRPMTKMDLEHYLVTVTVVEALLPLHRIESLRPDDGLVLTAGGKSGIVLPWEGKDPALRLKWAYQKAGVPIGSPATLRRLVGERWRE